MGNSTLFSFKNLLFICCLTILTVSPVIAQVDTPCEAAQRWEGGGTWNPNGTINDAPNAPDPNGIVRCGSSAETQSQVAPFNNSVYNSSSFLVDVSGLNCIDPSSGAVVNPVNPTNGEPIIWLNFDVRANGGSFQVQINDNSGDNVAWALYSSNSSTNSTTTGPSGDQLSGDCGNLTLRACGVESSSTWNTLPVPDFNATTNYYIAIWDQDADGDVQVNNFKARFGCGDADVLVCNLAEGTPETECNDDGTYTVSVPINGINGEFYAYDPNATPSLSSSVCLTNPGTTDVTSGTLELTYPQGTDYDITIFEATSSSPPIAVPNGACPDPDGTLGGADTCTANVSGTAPICFVCPTLNNEFPDITTCEDDQGQVLSVDTDVNNIDIKFVYFSSSQGDPYSGGTQLGTIVTPISGTATSSEGISGLAPGTYYAYAILDTNDTDLTDSNCRPSAEIIIEITEKEIPLFDAVDAICEGEVLADLPTTSSNGIVGTWSPALNNMATTEYTFTPADDECAETATLTITVNEKEIPLFDAVDAICEGEALADLPTTSSNGIEGTWSPALDNTVTTEYTFTPAADECAETATLTIEVGDKVVPMFDAVAAICEGEALANLPTTSSNGIEGTWSPALNNMATTEYTFTPADDECAETATLTITVNEKEIPLFDAVDAICEGEALADLPTTSSNGIVGTWSPALNNMATTEYTFTPADDECAETATLTITVNEKEIPLFDAVDAICEGEVLADLPTTSSNGIVGTWSPALNNMATTEYTFTPADDECAETATLTITVNEKEIPLFDAVDAICEGEALADLPTTSSNGIVGTWSPALNNMATTEYTFTPADDECAETATLTITVNEKEIPLFDAVAAICEGEVLADLPTTSSNGIVGTWSPALNNMATTEYTFTPADDECAETATLTISVNEKEIPLFDAVDAICEGEVLADLPTTSSNGISGTWSPALNNMATTEYTFTPADDECAETATLTITVNEKEIPLFDAVDAICEGEVLADLPTTSTNGISGTWSPALDNTQTTEYTFTPADGECAETATLTIEVGDKVVPAFDPVAAICEGEVLADLPTTSSNGISGTWSPALNNMVTTEYTFTPADGECAETATLTITVNEKEIPLFDAVDAICEGEVLADLPTTSSNGIVGTWSPALNNMATTEYTFTPADDECAETATLTITVNEKEIPLFDAVDAICEGEVLADLPTTSSNGIVGTWSPALNNMATTEYTFTPNDSECANTTTLTITVNEKKNPIFDAVDPICEGDVLDPLPMVSLHGIPGTWAPALDNMVTTEYTFTPDDSECANTTTLTITVNEKKNPIFDAVDPICEGDVLESLPTVSLHGIPGTWAPALDNTVTTEYTFTPADGECANTATLTITVNPAPMVEITGNDSYCYNGNGVVLDAGAGFASYEWSPGGETTRTITALEGSYTVTVTNGFGCATTSEAFMVNNNQQMACTIVQDVLTTDHLTEDGVATVNPSGGSGVYTYLWDNGETTQTATTLTYGMHSVTVTDSNGCETSCQIDIAKELYCWVNLVQNVTVSGGSDGAARVSGNGGYRPFTFQWEDGTTGAANNRLSAGVHYVTITDATGATSRCSVAITEPMGGNCDSFMVTLAQDKLTTDHLTQDGVATVYPQGGTAPFTYLWDNGETTQTATRLTYGLRTVTVTDANGCETVGQIDIAKELYCWINLYGNVTVHGGSDGSAKVQGNGGYRPFTYRWDDGSTAQLNNNLSVGTHYVTITDATGATSRCSITITEPNEEVCDGVDNDGDGQVDEGFDQDGDGVADCFDICDKGDDNVDMDMDGIPDACDDTICIKDDMPMTECYETAEWNEQTCSWDINGERPIEPMTECHQTAVWNGATCTWDINDGKPEMPMTLCYQTAVWSDQICDWEINGEKPLEPETECYETAVWNEVTCSWDIQDEKAEMPMTLCYQTAVWSDQTCGWDITGEQPEQPVVECYQTATFNTQTCEWDVIGEQPEMPVTECYETAVWNEQTCEWDIIENGNDADGDGFCSDVDCDDNNPDVFPGATEVCDGVDNNCVGGIDEGLDCNTGGIDQCETAFARSADENVRTCFLDIPTVSGNRWGWVNEFPSINGTYEMEVYAAAGQCDISKGALVGNVEVTYTDGSVDVTVTTLSGYKMTEAQLHVGSQILPTQGNGFTTAPGQYPYADMVDGDFTTYTFEGISAGDADNFYVVFHANVCPLAQNESLAVKRPVDRLVLKAYPVPFKENVNLNVIAPRNMEGTLSLFNGIGQKVKDFGQRSLRKGDNAVYLDTGELPVGTYFVRMNSILGNETLQVIRK